MTGERIYSVEVTIVGCPGDGAAVPTAQPRTLRYCDVCRRWGASGSTHFCRQNWRPYLSDLLVELAREGR